MGLILGASLKVNIGFAVLLLFASCSIPVLMAGTAILSSRDAICSVDSVGDSSADWVVLVATGVKTVLYKVSGGGLADV